RRTYVMDQNPQPPVSLWPDRRALGPITDLYQLTMMAGYLAAGMAGKRATFELFVRRMPPHRAYLVFAGLEPAIGDLLTARAAYIAGFDGTSHVEAARLLKIPASGTMAHSWVQSFDSEAEAF